MRSKDCARRSRHGTTGRIFIFSSHVLNALDKEMLLLSLCLCSQRDPGLLCGGGTALVQDLGDPWTQSSLGLGEGLGENCLTGALEVHGALTSVLSRSPICPDVTRRAVTPKQHLLCFLHGSLSNCLDLPKNSNEKLKRLPDGSTEEDLNSTGTLGYRGSCRGEKRAYEQDLEVESVFAACWRASPWHGQ